MNYFYLLFLSLFLIPIQAFANPVLSIESGGQAIENTPFAVDVMFDTKGSVINSVEATIAVSGEAVEFLGYQDEGSLIKLWIRPPTKSNDSISFAGSIPGGARDIKNSSGSDTKIPLVRLLFSTPKQQAVTVSVLQSSIFLHDGLGTTLTHSRLSKTITIKQKAVVEDGSSDNMSSFSKDTTPPLPIAVQFFPSSPFARTPSLLSFSTSDIESGISSYEIRIGRSTWKNVESPFVVPKKLLPFTVTISAYDSAGNTTNAIVEIPGIFSLFSVLAIIVTGLAGFLLVGVVKRRV